MNVLLAIAHVAERATSDYSLAILLTVVKRNVPLTEVAVSVRWSEVDCLNVLRHYHRLDEIIVLLYPAFANLIHDVCCNV